MDLASQQAKDLIVAIFKFLKDRKHGVFRKAAERLLEGNETVKAFSLTTDSTLVEKRSMLEKKWLTVLSLQKKIEKIEMGHRGNSPPRFDYSEDEERRKLDAAVYRYLKSQNQPYLQIVSEAMAEADPSVAAADFEQIMMLQHSWTSIPILQRKLFQLDEGPREKRRASLPLHLQPGDTSPQVEERDTSHIRPMRPVRVESKLEDIHETVETEAYDVSSVESDEGLDLSGGLDLSPNAKDTLLSRHDMEYDQPISDFSEGGGQRMIVETDIGLLPSIPQGSESEDTYEEEQIEKAISRAYLATGGHSTQGSRGAGKSRQTSVFSRMSVFGKNKEGRMSQRRMTGFRQSILMAVNLPSIRGEEERELQQGASLKPPEMELTMRFSSDEESYSDSDSSNDAFDEESLPGFADEEDAYNGAIGTLNSSVNSNLVQTPFEVTMEYDESSSDSEESSNDADLSENTTVSRVPMSRRQSIQAMDPFVEREGRRLCWQNMNMTVNGVKRVLDDCWGEIPPKELTAIMGSSGTGKSSIMNILSGRLQSSGAVDVQADILLDGRLVDPKNISVRRSIAYVAQDDSLPATATPREAIRFSAKMRLPRSTSEEELSDLTSVMLEELGLVECADTIVGSALIKGISGGQRKRTSVGLELVTHPKIVCLDEPTSGLDSFSALQCCEVLRKVANAGASVMFTIHQPSSEIFETFNHLILMNGGRVMYQGPITEISSYFGERGHPVPRNYNPADWILDVAQGVEIEELVEAGYFPACPESIILPKSAEKVTMLDSILGMSHHGASSSTQPPGPLSQTLYLFQREVRAIYRDWTVIFMRVVVMGTLAFFVGLIFFRAGDADKSRQFNLQSKLGAMMVVVITCMMSSVQFAMFVYPEERPIFLREYSTNHYSVWSYLMAHLTTEVFLIAMKVWIVVTVVYVMVGLQGSYLIYCLLTFTLSLAITAQATCAACLGGDNIQLATQLMPLIFQPQLLFAGFFVSPELMPSWLSPVQLACTMTYATRILVVEEFHECSGNPRERNLCHRMLESTRSDPDEVWWYWIVLLSIFVFFRFLAVFLLRGSAQTFY